MWNAYTIKIDAELGTFAILMNEYNSPYFKNQDVHNRPLVQAGCITSPDNGQKLIGSLRNKAHLVALKKFLDSTSAQYWLESYPDIITRINNVSPNANEPAYAVKIKFGQQTAYGQRIIITSILPDASNDKILFRISSSASGGPDRVNEFELAYSEKNLLELLGYVNSKPAQIANINEIRRDIAQSLAAIRNPASTSASSSSATSVLMLNTSSAQQLNVSPSPQTLSNKERLDAITNHPKFSQLLTEKIKIGKSSIIFDDRNGFNEYICKWNCPISFEMMDDPVIVETSKMDRISYNQATAQRPRIHPTNNTQLPANHQPTADVDMQTEIRAFLSTLETKLASLEQTQRNTASSSSKLTQ